MSHYHHQQHHHNPFYNQEAASSIDAASVIVPSPNVASCAVPPPQPIPAPYHRLASTGQDSTYSLTSAAAAAATAPYSSATLQHQNTTLTGVTAHQTSSTHTQSTSQIATDLLQINSNNNTNASRTSNQISSIRSAVPPGGIAGTHYHQHQAVTTASGVGGANYLSEVESAILRSSVPINLTETEEITVNGQRGIWANKAEVVNWRGVIPITEYAINEDAQPEIITKRTEQTLTYIQELAVRYLRPPTPPAPGEIIITQEINSLAPPAPPLIIRQQPPRPATPEPLVIREAPPPPPVQVGRKVITISGKRLPPPPRKVIIERLAPLPSKPQAVLVERWLPYSQVKRRVIFQRANERDPVIMKPRNVVVQWEAPQVVIKKDFKYLGIIRANPVEYVQRYGSSLKTSRELPDFVLDIKPPAGVVLAADYQYNQVHELEGDLQALRLVDLEREGLAEYRAQLQRLGINYMGQAAVAAELNATTASSYISNVNVLSPASTTSTSTHQQYTNNNNYNNATTSVAAAYYNQHHNQQQQQQQQQLQQQQYQSYYGGSGVGHGQHGHGIVSELFSQIDRDLNGRISVDEAEKLLLKLNSRLGRRFGEDDIKRFFYALDTNRDGTIDLQEFRCAFEQVL